MKKTVLALCAAVSLALLSGCAMTGSAPVNGFVFGNVKGPLLATTNTASSKVGEATCTSILGAFALGDCSIEAASKAGGITEVSTVDTKSINVLGIYASHTTVVRGR